MIDNATSRIKSKNNLIQTLLKQTVDSGGGVEMRSEELILSVNDLVSS